LTLLKILVILPQLRTVCWIEERTDIICSPMNNGNLRTVLHQDGIKSGLFFDVKTYRYVLSLKKYARI